MSYELEGTVEAILPREDFASGFSKQVMVVRTDEKDPQSVPVEFAKDKIDLLDKVRTRDRVKVLFNIRGSEWKSRYFVNLQAWKVERLSAQSNPAEQGSLPGHEEDDAGDIPF